MKLLKLKFKKTELLEIDTAVFNWLSSIRAQNILVTGLLIQEQTRKVAESLGVAKFKTWNGWLGKLQKRHLSKWLNITLKK